MTARIATAVFAALHESGCGTECGYRHVRGQGESWRVSEPTDIRHSALMILRSEQPHIAPPMSAMNCARSLAPKGEGSTNRDWVGRRGHAQKSRR